MNRTKWRIDELAAIVGRALETGRYDGQRSGRIRAVPDARTIRYYTTLGILDRPLEMQGRTAYYGQRHVQQLVAVKRLQANGLPLTQVQQQLAGIGKRKLAELAALPAGFFANFERPEGHLAGARPAELADPTPRADRFWAAMPDESVADCDLERPAGSGARAAVVLPIDDGAHLVLEGVSIERMTDAAMAELAPTLAILRQALRKLQCADTANASGDDTSKTEGESNG